MYITFQDSEIVQQIYTRDPRTCAILITAWVGLKLGVFRFFPQSEYLWFVRCIWYLHVLRSEHEHAKHQISREDHENICFAFVFACVGVKNPKTPKLSPMAENSITWGGIGGLGSLVYINGVHKHAQI